MDFVSFAIYNLVPGPYLAIILNWFLWLSFVVLVAGLVAELAREANMRGAYLWVIAVALAPPVVFPIFIWQRGLAAFNHKQLIIRRGGYLLALATLVALTLIQFILPFFIPELAPSFKPFKSKPSGISL